MTTYSYHLLTMPYAKCHVEFHVGNFSCLQRVRFYSYSTLMFDITVDRDADVLHIEYCHAVSCSTTTARQVNRFTTELFGSNQYYTFRGAAVGKVYPFPGFMQAINLWERYAMNGKVCR